MMAKCKSCEALIIWASTRSGKSMPLDEQPTPKGTMVLVKGQTWVATDEDRRLHRPLYMSHWATCPDALQWRSR